MYLCDKCCKMMALLTLVLGVLFLLQDLAVWAFWNLNWYTVAFLLMGLCGLCSSCCPTCKTETEKKVKK